MKLGTLRFSRQHRAARARMRQTDLERFRENLQRARVTDAKIADATIDGRMERDVPEAERLARSGLTPDQIDVMNQARAHLLDVMRGAYVWNTQGPPRHRSWWERLTGGRTTITYGER